MILLDTDILSELMKPQVSPVLMEKLISTPGGAIFISAMTHSEILYGLQRLPEGARKNRLAERIEGMLGFYADRCLEFDIHTASVLAEVRAEAEKRGRSIPLADAVIASTAIQHDLTLMTHNMRHFENIAQLKVSDPLAAQSHR